MKKNQIQYEKNQIQNEQYQTLPQSANVFGRVNTALIIYK